MIIHANQLGASYRGRTWSLAVDDLTLEPGVTGLVGVNGAGKSTLLRMLSGAQRPTNGTVTVNGQDLYGRGRRGQLGQVGYMPQEYALPRDAGVRQSLEYVGWMRGLSVREARAAARATLEKVGLTDVARQRVSKLSGGMLRRLCLAHAIVASPHVVLLDEPTTGLDPEQRAGLRELVEQLPDTAVTLVSSHVMEDIVTLAERVIVLEGGRVLYHGPLQSFCEEHGGAEASAEAAFLSLLMRSRSAACTR
jgi:ABC-2 type transport system ATP-binding protein